MRLIVSILILIFGLTSWIQADDIRDFEIEGISVGDSLLNFAEKDKILNKSSSPYNSKKYAMFSDYFPEGSLYDGYLVHYKTEDTKFIISALQGVVLYKDNYKECLKKKKDIVKNLDIEFSNLEKDTWEKKHIADKTGKSITNSTEYYLKTGFFRITCNDWSEAMDYVDKLTVTIASKDFDDWINNEAYK